MKKLCCIFPAIYLLSACNEPPKPPAVTPFISACPKDQGSGSDYHPFDQKKLLADILAGKNNEVFMDSFEQGDTIFGTHFTLDQGGGAFIGSTEASHYTRIPRADLNAPGEWGDPDRQLPRPTGPNAQSCTSCHNQPTEDGAGPTADNVHRIPQLKENPTLTIQRNTPHVFGAGALQRLAQEMTEELYGIKANAEKEACAQKGTDIVKELTAKGVSFGHITMSCDSGMAKLDTDKSKIEGIDPDWVVRPYEWKKNVAFLRDFMRHAGNNEIGMQAVELVGNGKNEDKDNKVDELSVGDITAFTVYMAAQARPTTKIELDDLGILTAAGQELKSSERTKIKHGGELFNEIDCNSCHKPEMTLSDPTFKEPSANIFYSDNNVDPSQQKNPLPIDMKVEGVDPNHPVTFDLTKDQPENQFCKGNEKFHLGALEKQNGKAVVRLYSDLKRYWMGDQLAETVDELEKTEEYQNGNMSSVHYDPVNAILPNTAYTENSNRGKATFGTEELWGVACTGPWMHDGRATTLHEAIKLHGGEAAASRNKFDALSEKDQKDVIAFLGNLVLYLNTAESGKVPDGLADICEVKD
jgi:Di-haem oxidoreductase, putative peroxidase